MNKIFSFSLFFASLFFASCSNDSGNEDEPSLGSDNKITSYTIEASKNGLSANIEGIINDETKTITLGSKVPAYKDLIATFTSEGDAYIGYIKQTSGKTAVNFAEEISYNIIAENGDTRTYKIIATPENDGEPLNSFQLKIKEKGVEKTLSGVYNSSNTIITLNAHCKNWIENINQAVALFETEGKVYVGEAEQQSGVTANDFSKELIYKVTSSGKPDRKYRVILVSPQSTGLPIMSIETDNRTEIKDKENYIQARCRLFDPNNTQNNIDESTGIRGRGNSTWTLYPKKPYRLKFENKVGLFGLGEAKSWVLRANYQDPTFIMNTIAFEIGRRLGLEFTNNANHVELFVNKQYKGSYLLTEQVQVNKHRVDIDKTNGFLIELDNYFDEELKFRSARNLPVNIKSPEDASCVEAVEKIFNDFENAMYANNGKPSGGYKNLVDINSVIGYLLVNEVTYNGEIAHPKSLYMYKDNNKKIHFGPVWDFDWGFCHAEDGIKYFGETGIRLFSSQTGGSCGYLIAQFFKDAEFRSAYKAKWNSIKPQLYDLDQFIADYGTYLRKSGAANLALWYNEKYYNYNYDEQINKMRLWLKNRIDYLDREINAD
ncbi:hypothetical protein D0T53_12230 [Dysgonomonas sp. 216]|uniref:CotH kinase family protein n=1 Tax=Dysgonomonas sp. 216 TaxID=2302934 RepID=UPI0013D0F059|nr:CotH kinase family protein [Dysgonomonas sp. 216]NDW19671.1 hypothetical protein [Dysgonomonas sp. 216]